MEIEFSLRFRIVSLSFDLGSNHSQGRDSTSAQPEKGVRKHAGVTGRSPLRPKALK
jgi:hypothetical protein